MRTFLKTGIAVIALLAYATINMTTMAQTDSTYALIGHRGAAHDAPENTLASLKRALELGVDRIEIDVHMTSDGKIVLMHDRTLDRTTTGKGAVKDHTLEEIRGLDAGAWFSESFKGEKVPTLEEAIQLIKGRCQLMIEVKNHSGYTPGIEKAVAQIIREQQASESCVVISLRHKVVRNFHLMAPDIRLQRSYVGKLPWIPVYITNFIGFRGLKRYPYVEEFNFNKGFISRCILKRAAKLGKKISAWTDDDPEHAMKLVKKGANGIITNNPGAYRKKEN